MKKITYYLMAFLSQLEMLRNRHFLIIDALLMPSVAVLALALRFDLVHLLNYKGRLLVFIIVATPLKLATFYFFSLYKRFWRYASIDEVILIVEAATVASLIAVTITLLVAFPLEGIVFFPRSIFIIDWLLTIFVLLLTRYSTRVALRQHQLLERRQKRPVKTRRALIVGAGDAGTLLARDMEGNPSLNITPVGFIDDDTDKQGVLIYGLPVLGTRLQIPATAEAYNIDLVIIAMPSASGEAVRDITRICDANDIPVRILPSTHALLTGQVSMRDTRGVKLEDLLRRETVRTDLSQVRQLISGRRVVVTGAGGSIGSELCRQIAWSNPDLLILVGHGETSLFHIRRELDERVPGVRYVTFIGDIRDQMRMEQLFRTYQPELVFHAAAHKHLWLMEQNPVEAITNNVLGTRQLLELAVAHNVPHFVLISTDKAVNPTSLMGASKRVAELLVQEMARRTGRSFVSVRFGNVLGSRGSIVPILESQIRRGGPLTITHPEVKRFFMTIPEAVQLVLQAATMGGTGEIFVLDMGEPIRIVDLARQLLGLHGLTEGKDIQIKYIGLYPGEKLSEDLFYPTERYERTIHEKIFIARNDSRIDPSDLDKAVELLMEAARRNDRADLLQGLRVLIPEFQPAFERGMDNDLPEKSGNEEVLASSLGQGATGDVS